MSPEQVRGQEVDTRSDIFSFGVVLYEMLAGVHPFKKGGHMETAQAVLSDTAPPLTRYTEDIPLLLQHTVMKMLAKEPNSRYQLIHEVRTNLSGLIDEITGSRIETGESIAESSKGTGGHRDTRVAERSWRRVIPWGIAGLLGALAAFALWSLWDRVPMDSSTVGSFGESRPVVVMMDTPARPYDEEDRDLGLTNADVIADFLGDFGVLDLRKESTSPQWNREDTIVSWNPDLIIMHYGCFATGGIKQAASYEKFESFLEYVASSTKSHVLVYSRGRQFWAGSDQEGRTVAILPSTSEFLRGYETRLPLSGRITMLGFADAASASFRDPSVVRRVKLEVKRILELE
jgi:hypothetical protein